MPDTIGNTVEPKVTTGAEAAARADVHAFRRDGHVRLRGIYRPSEIVELDRALGDARRATKRLSGDADEQLERDAFLWRQSDDVASYALDPRLGALAADLIGADGIRLIHDVALDKGPEHGPTPWHRDSDFWSFEGAGALTMWIPLDDIALEMGPLRYATRSHRARNLRVLHRLEKPLIPARFAIASSALAIGDVAVHHYRTLHGAGRNRGSRTRRAYAVHLVDADATYRESRQAGHLEHAHRCGWDRLANGAPLSEEIAPLVYRRPR